jgi:mRNA-degrading endonuclease RelE of RelBE toxin-antitoxin system
VSEQGAYELVLTPPEQRPLAGKLPEPVAAAVIELVTTTLIQQPTQVGKPLRDDLAGVWSARRGTYRVLYRIREDLREVIVLRIEHRRDAYRPLQARQQVLAKAARLCVRAGQLVFRTASVAVLAKGHRKCSRSRTYR